MNLENSQFLHDFIDQIYRISLSDGKPAYQNWPALLEKLAGLCGASRIALLHRQEATASRQLLHYNLPFPALQTYHRLLDEAKPVADQGWTFSDDWFALHFPMEAGLIHPPAEPPNPGHTLLVLHRDAASAPFSPQVPVFLQRIFSHLARALSVDTSASAAQLQQTMLQQLYDRMQLGLLLLDTGGKVVFHNTRAARILDGPSALVIKKHRLRCGLASEQKRLNSLIDKALDARLLPRRESMLATGVKDQEIHLVVLPAANVHIPLHMPHESGAVIFLHDGRQPIDMPAAWLQDLYGLTSKEARTARIIANGDTLDHYAEHSHVSLHTLRSQLKQVMRKTGTNSQAQLAQLLLSDPLLMFCQQADATNEDRHGVTYAES